MSPPKDTPTGRLAPEDRFIQSGIRMANNVPALA